MSAIPFPNLEEHVRALPAAGSARERRLRRLVDAQAEAEAAAALEATAARVREDEGALACALRAAAALEAPPLSSRSEDAARDALRDAVASPGFLLLVPAMVRELRATAAAHPDTGACTIASALELWSWTMRSLLAGGGSHSATAVDELADAVRPLLAARCFAVDAAPAAPGLRSDLCHAWAARAAALAAAVCAQLVFGERQHLTWDAAGCDACWGGDELDELEALMPGFASGARMSSDVIEPDGSHPAKEGPCARFDGLDAFVRLRTRLDGCLTGARIARERAAAAIARAGRRS